MEVKSKLTEGYVRKGGQNLTSQIKTRPGPPPAFKPTGGAPPPWDTPPDLIIDALSSSLRPRSVNLDDPDAMWRAMSATGIRPSVIGWYWREAVNRAREMRNEEKIEWMTL